MVFTQTKPENDPHDVLEIESILAGARAHREAPTLAPEADSHKPASPGAVESSVSPAASAPKVDATFRAAAVGATALHRKSGPVGRWTVRTFLGLSFAVATAAAAVTTWQGYGDSAKEIVANWTPYVTQAWSTLAARPGGTEQLSAQAAPSQAPVQADATAAPAQPAEVAAPTIAALSPESTQLLQSLAHELATMGQQIQQLKATIEQLKAGQEQISRDIAKADIGRSSEARSVEPRARASTVPRPTVASPRNPRPSYPPAQTALPPPRSAAAPVAQQMPPAMPVAPERPQAAPRLDDEPVPRPPMPMR